MIVDMLPVVNDAGEKTFERATPEYTLPAITAQTDLICICGNPCCLLGPFVERRRAGRPPTAMDVIIAAVAQCAWPNFARDAFTFIAPPVCSEQLARAYEAINRVWALPSFPWDKPDPLTREGERSESMQEFLDKLGATAAMIEKVSR